MLCLLLNIKFVKVLFWCCCFGVVVVVVVVVEWLITLKE